MKRILPLFVVALTLALVVTPLWAASAAPAKSSGNSPANGIATAVTTVTGIAISPLLGTGAYGAYQYFSTKGDEAKAALPWYAQMNFWLPALAIVGLVAAKDALGAVVPPGMKKPLDVLETIENKASGLVAAGAVVPFTMDAVSKMLIAQVPAAAPAVNSGGLAMIQFGAIDFSWLLNLLTVPFGIAMFAIVWMASHAINVLILLSPWGAIDAALKAGRTALLGLLTLTATMNPLVSAAMSVVVIIIAYLVAGWAFRLTIFGTIFSWDFFTLRRKRFSLAPADNKLFSGGNLPEVPVRTYGRLRKTEGGLSFTYKPWLVLPEKTVNVPAAGLVVGKGLFFSTMLNEVNETWFILPPRYRGHEEDVANLYGLAGVRPAGLRRAWSAVRELFGGGAAQAQMT